MMAAFRALACSVLLILSFNKNLFAQDSLLENTISKESLHQLISFIAADSMYGRATGSVGNARAAAFIVDQLEKAGAHPLAGNDGYLMPFNLPATYSNDKGEPITAYNIIGVLPGRSKPGEVIIFSAHYDHIDRRGPMFTGKSRGKIDNSDAIFNGANDNASGVSAMITLARYFGQLKNNERTIMFIAFSGEELGLLGSWSFVRNINPDNFIAVLNLEMLGGRHPGYYGKPFITGNRFSNLYQILNSELSTLNRKKYGKKYFTVDNEDLFHRSDNYPFAKQGIPAHTIMAGSSQDERYHTVSDEVETLNINKMTEVVRAIALSARSIISGVVTPRRINPDDIPSR